MVENKNSKRKCVTESTQDAPGVWRSCTPPPRQGPQKELQFSESKSDSGPRKLISYLKPSGENSETQICLPLKTVDTPIQTPNTQSWVTRACQQVGESRPTVCGAQSSRRPKAESGASPDHTPDRCSHLPGPRPQGSEDALSASTGPQMPPQEGAPAPTLHWAQYLASPVAHLCPQAPRPLQDATGVREQVSLPSHQTVPHCSWELAFPQAAVFSECPCCPRDTQVAVKAPELRCCARMQAALVRRSCHSSLTAGLSLQWAHSRWQVCSQAARLSAC